jgi:DNA-binding transcriptional LysR family regulator
MAHDNFLGLIRGPRFRRAVAADLAPCGLGAKHAFLKAGLGWGHMPLHMVKTDLESRLLVKIRVETVPRAVVMPMSVVFRKDAPPGPAGRAFIAQLKPK